MNITNTVLKSLASIGVHVTDEAKFSELLGNTGDPAKLVQIAAVGRRDNVRLFHSRQSREGLAADISRVLSISDADALRIAANVAST